MSYCTVDNVSLHLKNVFKEAELSEKSVVTIWNVTEKHRPGTFRRCVFRTFYRLI